MGTGQLQPLYPSGIPPYCPRLERIAYFFGSAWLSPEGDKVVAVYTNMSDKAVRLGETHVGWSNEAKSIATYTTTGSKNLVEGTVAAGKQVILEAKSVTTVVYSLK